MKKCVNCTVGMRADWKLNKDVFVYEDDADLNDLTVEFNCCPTCGHKIDRKRIEGARKSAIGFQEFPNIKCCARCENFVAGNFNTSEMRAMNRCARFGITVDDTNVCSQFLASTVDLFLKEEK